MISAVVAVDNNWGIGYNGELLEWIPADLKRFKELTSGMDKCVVMGRKTWDSLPKKPLPKRMNFIITRHTEGMNNQAEEKCWNYYYLSMEDLKDIMLDDLICDYFIIGGGQIYKELLPLCDRVYVTKIFKEHENVDTYFPDLDEPEMWDTWQVAAQSKVFVEDDLMYQFVEYDRIS